MSTPVTWTRTAVIEGWLDPLAAAKLRAELVALLDLRDKAREWRAVRLQTATGFPWQDGVRTHDALAAAVDALQPTEGAQP